MVELLVTVTIIILLTSVGIFSYQASNKKARDNKRKADLEQVRAALEMYRSDNDSYPVGYWTEMITALKSGKYLNEVPQDPKGYSYYYSCCSDGNYLLCAYFETGGNGNDCGDNCGAPANCNYQLTNP